MSGDLFQIRPLAGKIGAEITGLDLRQLDDNQTWDAFQQAFLKHKVLAIRDQELAPDDMMAISEKFGGPCDYLGGHWYLILGHNEMFSVCNDILINTYASKNYYKPVNCGENI